MKATAEKAIAEKVGESLNDVKDPEIPSVSIAELGMVHRVDVRDGVAYVELLPTFSGCPALGIIEQDVKDAVGCVDGVRDVTVRFVFHPPWTTDRITPEGRENLKAYGISPPTATQREGEPWTVDCPYCGSPYTTLENIFGPTACRSLLYCTNCKNPFEAMKPVATWQAHK